MSRRVLNNKQLDVLLCLYKFRFATRLLISKYQEASLAYSHYRLNKLLSQEYIGRKYEGKDKIQGKQAKYYLLPKGINTLKRHLELNLYTPSLNACYKDHSASESFMNRCLTIFEIYHKFSELYSSKLTFYSKSEIAEYDFFPKILPDGYMQLLNKFYTLEYLSDNLTYASIKSRIRYLIEHLTSTDWEDLKIPEPSILFIIKSPYTMRQVQGLVNYQINISGNEPGDINIYTTTLKSLLNAPNKNTPIWSRAEEPMGNLTLT